MRPKFVALLAVSAMALVGCSAASPEPAPAATYPAVQESPIASASATSKPAQTANPNAQVEKQFADFAELRSSSLDVKVPKRSQTIESLHAYCDSGEAIEVFNESDLNSTLENAPDQIYCNELK